jgi:hypothetical protein
MSDCRRKSSYIDGRVFVTGDPSVLNTHNPKEIGVLPPKGLTNEVLTKCSDQDYHVHWSNILTLISSALNFENALTLTGGTVTWEGDLIKNTTVNGVSTYSTTFLNINDFNVISSKDIVMRSLFGLYVQDSNKTDITGRTLLNISTPNRATKTNGSLLQLLNNGNGQVEYTNFAFPTSDGATDQVLQTDGLGNVNWVDPSSLNSVNLYNSDGTLTGNRNASGGGIYRLRFTNMTAFTVSNISTQIELSTPGIIELNPSELQIKGLTNSGTVGRILQYVNASTEEAYWTPYDLPTTTPNTGDMLVATDTDSLGFQSQFETISYHVADANVDLSTIAGSPSGERFFSIPSRLNGWKLYSITLLNDSTAGVITSLDYDVTQNGGTILTSDSWGPGHYEDDTVIAHTLSTGDIIKFTPISGGTNLLGLSITFTLVSN